MKNKSDSIYVGHLRSSEPCIQSIPKKKSDPVTFVPNTAIELRSFDLSHSVDMTIGKVHSRIEQKMQLVIKPKPRWMPLRFYHWLLSKLLVMEHFK